MTPTLGMNNLQVGMQAPTLATPPQDAHRMKGRIADSPPGICNFFNASRDMPAVIAVFKHHYILSLQVRI